MALLTWLESTGLSTWVREGESIWAFPTILTLHTFGLGLLVGANTIVNLRLLGIGRRVPLEPLRPLFSVMWGGFWLNAFTGSLLFAADATERGTSAVLPVEAGVRGNRRRGDGRDQTIRVRRAARRARRFSEADGACVAGSMDGGDHDGRLLAYV